MMEHYEYTFEDLMHGLDSNPEETNTQYVFTDRELKAIEAAKKLYFKLSDDLEATIHFYEYSRDLINIDSDMVLNDICSDIVAKWFGYHKEEIELCQILIPNLSEKMLSRC